MKDIFLILLSSLYDAGHDLLQDFCQYEYIEVS